MLFQKRSKIFFIVLLMICSVLVSQNEAKRWYFGGQAGLNFNTSPPTILTNGAMTTGEGCASNSDASGNLLFYTDGVTIWNSSHVAMANGTGLTGNSSTSQSALVIKKPGSTSLYYVFTLGAFGTGAFNYSIIDMTLASGAGSVTVKNATISTGNDEKLTATTHCNAIDFWVMTHQNGTNNFKTYLLTSAGLSLTPVVSSIGSGASTYLGYCMKLSPNGKKLGASLYVSNVYELFDFDNTSGAVTNSLSLPTNATGSPYGCEFSPDGSKFYGSLYSNGSLFQWNLCAGSNTAIVASQYTVYPTTGVSKGALQLGPDGKIYVARYNQSTLGVIANPNGLGSLCSYTELGQSVSPKISYYGLPNYIGSSFFQHIPPQPFTYTVNNNFGCQTASYTAPPATQSPSLIGCAAVGYSLTGVLWSFGDPGSGTANTSTLNSPSHAFPALGTYTTQLIMYYSCGGGTDTLRQVVNINQPCISVSSTSITCANLGSATVQATGGTGPYSYTWTPSAQAGSVATGMSPGTYTITVFDFGNNFTYTATTNFTSLIPLTGNLNNTPSLACYGASTGTANFTGIAGGSGTQSYFWNNGITSYTAPNPVTLTAGNYSVTVTDALTGCTINRLFSISQPPEITLTISSPSPSTCAGSSIALTGTSSGGTPLTPGGYSYSWTAGPGNFSYSPSQLSGGTFIYTLTAADFYNCKKSQTISVNVINNPVLAVGNASICPLQAGTMSVFGASSYTWNGVTNGNTFTDNPLITTAYSVVGSAAGCTSSATASITLKAIPVPTISTNSPLCNASKLLLTAVGGASYLWKGPSAYNSSVQNPTINPVGLINAGVYNLTVTAVNGCTASVNSTVQVNPTPTMSVAGSTVCTGSTFTLSSVSAGSIFTWLGPSGFTSSQQNNFISNATSARSGVYILTVTSVNGCTNTATASVSVVPTPSPNISLSGATVCAQALNGSTNVISVLFSGASTYTLTTPSYLSNSNPNGPASSVSPLPPYSVNGPVTLTLTGSNGVCSTSTTAVFQVIPNPVVTLNSISPVICAGQSYTFLASGAGSYTWNSVTPSNILSITGSTAVTTPGNTSVYLINGTSLGCNSATESITLTVNPLPQFSVNPNPAILCKGSSALLKAEGNATTYSWSPPVFLSATLGSSVFANPMSLQNYQVVGTLNSCTNSALTTVSVIPIPVAGIITSKTEFCANETIAMSGTGGITYQWQGPSGFSAHEQNIKLNALSSAFSGVYTLTVSDINSCKNSTTQQMLVRNLPQGYLGGGQMEGCAPLCTTLNFKTSSGTASIVSMDFQYNNNTISGNGFSYCFNTAGHYLISSKLVDVYNCSNIITSTVMVYPNPVADFGFKPEQPLEGVDEIQFTDASTGASQHYWAFGSSNTYSNLKNPTFMFSDQGIYAVALVVKNQWQCSDTVVKAIRVESDFAVYVPGSFTPNGDGLNELFFPVIRGAKSFAFSIFDRWGEKLFETSDATKEWDGKYKGQWCKNDTYIWKLHVVSESNVISTQGRQEKNLVGTVILNK